MTILVDDREVGVDRIGSDAPSEAAPLWIDEPEDEEAATG